MTKQKPVNVSRFVKFFNDVQEEQTEAEKVENEMQAQRRPSQTMTNSCVQYPEMAVPVMAAPSQWRSGLAVM